MRFSPMSAEFQTAINPTSGALQAVAGALKKKGEAAKEKPAGREARPAVFSAFREFDQGMSPATNFGMTGPPISVA
ncbi:hypothetical protein MSC49_34640 [Methylosinus sp. C49]|uniref:hypothetical protein n=1 Tax=Methylosinus sp. C49 TaxID=2699395 RepID=UPI0013672100|nr:hypothetical protein [Methylosinus sp. C49]BBU63529.1 hypothetical protein MSC49_34640 [Methylosinus sp. C49]